MWSSSAAFARRSTVAPPTYPGEVVTEAKLRYVVLPAGAGVAALITLDNGHDHTKPPLGLPLSPFELLGLVGPAVALHVAETLHVAYPDRFHVSANLGRLVAAGNTGMYAAGADGRQRIDPDVAALLSAPGGGTPPTGDEVRNRAVEALAQEVRLMLDEDVVAEPQDIDLCMLLGAGWPFHLGGITPYLDRTGVSQRVPGRRFLPPGIASLP